MNLEQAAQFVKNPQELNLSHAESLKSLSDKHPYTSVYSLLYLTALANGKSPDLDEALAKYAYKISDRTRLYHLLKGEKDVIIEEVIEPISSPLAESDTRQSHLTLIPAETNSAQALQRGNESNGSVAESENIPPQNVEIIEEAPVSQVERKTEAEIGFDFEKVTTAHSMEQFVELEEVPKPEEEPDATDSQPETEPAVQEKTEITEENHTEFSENTETEDELKIEEPVKSDFKSFGSWLKSGNSQAESAPKTVEKSPSADLIEKFIQEEPKITRNKSEFFSPSRKAKESLNEDAVPVSETLAKIYAAQGNYPKAIHVYHQLMLSIPEKKSFFAIQIEELKQKITS